MARARPPRPEPVDPLDRELIEACAEAEEIKMRRLLAEIRRSNAIGREELSQKPCNPGS